MSDDGGRGRGRMTARGGVTLERKDGEMQRRRRRRRSGRSRTMAMKTGKAVGSNTDHISHGTLIVTSQHSLRSWHSQQRRLSLSSFCNDEDAHDEQDRPCIRNPETQRPNETQRPARRGPTEFQDLSLFRGGVFRATAWVGGWLWHFSVLFNLGLLRPGP